MPGWYCLKINNDDYKIRNMKNLFHHFVLFLFPTECNGVNTPLSNQLIYSQLKNRLVMMTAKPSSWIAKWKYTGALPLLLIALVVFSFRPKENDTPVLAQQTDNTSTAVKDGNTEKPIFPGCEKLNLMEIED